MRKMGKARECVKERRVVERGEVKEVERERIGEGCVCV